MNIGDLVICKRYASKPPLKGVIVKFNKKGDGGKDFVHVLIGEKIECFMQFDIEVVSELD